MSTMMDNVSYSKRVGNTYEAECVICGDVLLDRGFEDVVFFKLAHNGCVKESD